MGTVDATSAGSSCVKYDLWKTQFSAMEGVEQKLINAKASKACLKNLSISVILFVRIGTPARYIRLMELLA